MQIRGLSIKTRLIISCIFAWLPHATAAEAEAPKPPADVETSTESTPTSGSERRRAGDKGGIFRPTEGHL